MVTRTTSIKNFLTSATHPVLSEMYNHDMECQVNVAIDDGDSVEGEYKGKQWRGYTDGLTTWKPLRIPYKANTSPEYTDVAMKFDIAAHAEAIGMTGWDWVSKVSRWVAYDFDSMVGHAEAHQNKLTEGEMDEVLKKAKEIPWVTLRRSTSGNGLHLYVFLDPVPTSNHNEHAALARAILGMMSALTGFNFCHKVDICGGNMWVWHRKMKGTNGLEMIRQGETLTSDLIPTNWPDHVKVIKGRHQKTLPNGLVETFQTLTARKVNVQLDEDHRGHFKWLQENNTVWWWDQDHHMLITHTKHLEEMHTNLQLTGAFHTYTTHSSSQNCFCFPLRNGAWVVRRYSIGVQDHPMWEQDGEGWTKTFFNTTPTIQMAARSNEGIENTKGEFEFSRAETAVQAALLLGCTIEIDPKYITRQAWIKRHKDGRLLFALKREDTDSPSETMKSWSVEKNRYIKLISIIQADVTEAESSSYEDMVRHLVSEEREDAGWMMNNGGWHFEPLAHIRLALASYGMTSKETSSILGASVINCWKLVNQPFQPEYPGDRLWNLKAARLQYDPSDPSDDLNHKTWDKVLNHCGQGIDEAVLSNPWCKVNHIKTGGDYLKLWMASMIQDPYAHLPYLFFYSKEQGTGKTTFYEAHSKLFTRGYIKANRALKSEQGFNSELHGAVMCAIEEEDLGGKNKSIYDRIKDWVTGSELLIHPKGKTPYHVKNTTHWIQCSNDHKYCPVFPGDTRVTMITVKPIDPLEMIPEPQLVMKLKKESPDYLSSLIHLEIPECDDRLRIPALDSVEKKFIQAINMSELEVFISERTLHCKGAVIKYSDFYDQFVNWLDTSAQSHWSKHRLSRELPPDIPKGRSRADAQWNLCNIKWVNDVIQEETKHSLVVDDKNYITKQMVEVKDD